VGHGKVLPRKQFSETASEIRVSSERVQADLARASAQAAVQESDRQHTLVADQDGQTRAPAARQRADEDAHAAAAAESSRREPAWQRFYRPSPGCTGSLAGADCANEYVRAKKDFAERFVADRL
jgi:hypothetical protein